MQAVTFSRVWLMLFLAAWPLPALAAEDDLVIDGPAQPRPELRVQQVGAENIDQWVFQTDAAAGEQRMRNYFKLQLAELMRLCQLSDEQRQKLELAARGDMQRFLDAVEMVRQKYISTRNNPNQVNEVWQDIQPLQMRLARGVTGPGSLLMKTIPRTLTPEQLVKHGAEAAERRRFRYEANVSSALRSLEDCVALKHEQREALRTMLLELPAPPSYGNYDVYVVLARLAELPAAKIEPLFDKRQWAALKPQLEQSRQMKDALRAQGLLASEELAPPATEAQP